MGPAGDNAHVPQALPVGGELLIPDTEVIVNAGDTLFFPGEDEGPVAGISGDGPLVLWLENLHTARDGHRHSDPSY